METAHITSRKTYFLIYLALLGLLAATFGIHYLNLGPWNTFLAVGIATLKALLVILFFMHIRYSPPLTRFYVLAGLVWLAILFGLTLTDYLSRVGGF